VAINFVAIDTILRGHATYSYYNTYQSILAYDDTLKKGVDHDASN
jgi:hypothetical protein